MDYSIVNQTLDICMAIISKIHKQRPEFITDMAIQDCSQDRGEFNIYVSAGHDEGPLARPRISVMLTEFEPGKLSSEIMAELEIHDHDHPDSSIFSADAILKLCGDLKPLVAETLIHRPPDPISEPCVTENIVNRMITIKFKIHDEFYEADEDYMFNIDEGEIATQAMPYIEALVGIHSKIGTWKDSLR